MPSILRERSTPLGIKLHLALVTTAVVSFPAFLAHWNLLGFHL